MQHSSRTWTYWFMLTVIMVFLAFSAGIAVGEGPTTTTTGVGSPTGDSPSNGTPLPDDSTPPPTPSAPSNSWTGSDGKLAASPETTRNADNTGTWTLTWVAIYALAWGWVTTRKLVTVPVYEDRQITVRPFLGWETVTYLAGYTQEPRTRTWTETVLDYVEYYTEWVYSHTRYWYEKVYSHTERWIEKVYVTTRHWTEWVQQGYKTVWVYGIVEYEWVWRRVYSHTVWKSRLVYSHHEWQWVLKNGDEWVQEYTAVYKTEWYQEDIYEWVQVEEPVYGYTAKQEPNMVLVDRYEDVYQDVQMSRDVYVDVQRSEKIYEPVNRSREHYKQVTRSETYWVDVPVYYTREVAVYGDPVTTWERFEVGTREEWQDVPEYKQTEQFQHWEGSWAFAYDPGKSPAEIALNNQLYAVKVAWWEARLAFNTAVMAQKEAEANALRAQGAYVSQADMDAMNTEYEARFGTILHDGLYSATADWYRARQKGDAAAMAAAESAMSLWQSRGASSLSSAEIAGLEAQYPLPPAPPTVVSENTVTNADGSTTKTTVWSDGKTEEFTERPDGSTKTITTYPDGTREEMSTPPTKLPPSGENPDNPPPTKIYPNPVSEAACRERISQLMAEWWQVWIDGQPVKQTDIADEAAFYRSKAQELGWTNYEPGLADKYDMWKEKLVAVKHAWYKAGYYRDTAEQARLAEIEQALKDQRLGNQAPGSASDGDLTAAETSQIAKLYTNVGREPTVEELAWIQALFGITSEDGVYGPQTKVAIAQVQKEAGLTVDFLTGIGDQTIAALKKKAYQLMHQKWELVTSETYDEAQILSVSQRVQALLSVAPVDVKAELQAIDAAYQVVPDLYRLAVRDAANAPVNGVISPSAELSAMQEKVQAAEKSGKLNMAVVNRLRAPYLSAINHLNTVAEAVRDQADDDDYARLLAMLRAAAQGDWALIATAKATVADYGTAWFTFDGTEKKRGLAVANFLATFLPTEKVETVAPPPLTETGFLGLSVTPPSIDELPARLRELKWTQDSVNAVWYDAMKRKVDPRLMLAIIIQEGTGSFNTSSENRAGDGQNGPNPDFGDDLNRALAHVMGKFAFYGQAVQKNFVGLAQANNLSTVGQSGPSFGNVIQFINWRGPIDRQQLPCPPGHEDTYYVPRQGYYANHASWCQNVAQFYLDMGGNVDALSQFVTANFSPLEPREFSLSFVSDNPVLASDWRGYYSECKILTGEFAGAEVVADLFTEGVQRIKINGKWHDLDAKALVEAGEWLVTRHPIAEPAIVAVF